MSSDKIRVFIVDDHPMVRTGLSAMISSDASLKKVGEADNGPDALRLIPAASPHVVLMDLVLPGMDGIEVSTLIRRQRPELKVLMLTSLVDPVQVERAIGSGVSGFLLKNASAQELASAIRSAYAGRRVLAPDVTDALIANRQQIIPGADLTQRERELLALMTKGYNNQEIAGELAISIPTVKFHITNILSKLQVENRTEAVLAAIKHKLAPPP